MATVFSMSEPGHAGTDPVWIKRLVTGSILALVLISGAPTYKHLLRRKSKPQQRSAWFKNDEMLSLRASIVGQGKRDIAAMFGPPKALGNGHIATWYYALDNTEHVAMAIRFDDDHAHTVEFFKSPV